MVQAFFPEGPPQMMRSRFPTPPSPPPDVFQLRRLVDWADVDGAQHVNNAAYLAFMEDCAMCVLAAYDWPLVRIRAESFAILARRHHIEYQQPALLGDELELATWLSDVKRTSAVRHYTVTRASDDALLARARTLLQWADAETEQPVAIPAAFLRDLAPNVTDVRRSV
jgi:acyl-CoA thioester hydrolase